MKLEQFKEKDHKKKITIGISIVLVLLVAGIIVYRSFAFYEEKKAFDVIKGQVPDQNYDLMFSFYVKDENGNMIYQETMPEGTNYRVSVTCSDGATGSWDYEVWGPRITNLTNTRTKCKLFFQTGGYQESILNGTDPVLKEGLIPVTISDDGTVRKADTRKEWYSYANQRWANAVILNEGKKAEDYTNKIIPESDIESYFVWIPKYRYKLWDLGNYNSVVNGTPTESKAKEIEVVFGIENTENINGESCVTPMTSGATGECNVGEYMTHPAFISLGVKGLWVGKFETGYKGATTTAEAQQNIYDSSKVNIKPNVYSWRNSTVNNMFKTSYNYNRELNSHMMKNTEWGAVAYLSHSKYGINKEININNNSAYLTGYSAVVGTDQSSYPGTYGTDASKTLPYNTSTGYLASTTGNITGIYDMSGGANEYVSAYMSGKIGSSGFNDITNVAYAKYIDVYNASSAMQTYQYRILGDATGEIGPFLLYKDRDGNSREHNNWYADSSSFVESSGTWFRRSGNYDYGILAGQFNFARSTGAVNSYLGFRLVLAI